MSDFYDFTLFCANFPLSFAYFLSNKFLKYIILHPVETTLFRDNETKTKIRWSDNNNDIANNKSN